MRRLDILSDPICPWCHIAKAEFDGALADRAKAAPEIHWHPFRLNPDMPAEGMDRRAYLEAKFGGPRRAAGIYGHIAERAEAAGLMLNLAAIERTPDTTDAHRLIRWAGTEGCQEAVVAGLFTAYFEQGQDISDHGVLRRVAGAAGMDRARVARRLAGATDRDAVIAAESAARAGGVTGVPTFIIDGTHVVNGAQPAGSWTRIIDETAGAGASA